MPLTWGSNCSTASWGCQSLRRMTSGRKPRKWKLSWFCWNRSFVASRSAGPKTSEDYLLPFSTKRKRVPEWQLLYVEVHHYLHSKKKVVLKIENIFMIYSRILVTLDTLQLQNSRKYQCHKHKSFIRFLPAGAWTIWESRGRGGGRRGGWEWRIGWRHFRQWKPGGDQRGFSSFQGGRAFKFTKRKYHPGHGCLRGSWGRSGGSSGKGGCKALWSLEQWCEPAYYWPKARADCAITKDATTSTTRANIQDPSFQIWKKFWFKYD